MAGFCTLFNATAAEFETTTWSKYNNVTPTNSDTTSTGGRIPLGTNGKGDDVHNNSSAVIKVGSTYRMWHMGYDGANWRIYLATSLSPAGTLLSFH
ncbi:MAG: hypothetical protein HYV36_02615 [Lentisphaerae bacterium]|nr:hypothetical protein [Lentisphaerota bacterium]